MATLLSIGTATPPHVVTRRQTVDGLADLWNGRVPRRAVEALVDNSLIDTRHMVLSVEQVLAPRSSSETARIFEREAPRLADAAGRAALDRAGLRPADVSLLVVAAATGFNIPATDSYLFESLELPTRARRLPIAQLGCLGGVAGLARTAELLDARPDGVALFCCVELPSLSFRSDAFGVHDLVAATLFGDGAAAAILVPDGDPRRGARSPLRLLGSRSEMYPRARELMAFRIADRGFDLTLGRDIPWFAAAQLPSLVRSLLAPLGRRPRDVTFYAFHAGGRRVLDEAAKALELPTDALWASYRVMARNGNMSSPTALFALDELLGRPSRRVAPGDLGLLAAFGPGFAAEVLAVEALP